MNTKQLKPRPMTEEQLEYVKKQIIQIYLFLISNSGKNPMVVELEKDRAKKHEIDL